MRKRKQILLKYFRVLKTVNYTYSFLSPSINPIFILSLAINQGPPPRLHLHIYVGERILLPPPLPNNYWTHIIININCEIITDPTRNSLNIAPILSNLCSVEDEYTRSCDNKQNSEQHEFNKNVIFFSYNCINQNESIEFQS